MAGVYVAITTPAKATLAANTTKTILTFVVAANYQVEICKVELTPFGTNSSNAAIEAWLEVQTGTPTGTAANASVVSGPAITLSSIITSQTYAVTAEGTPGATWWRLGTHPQGFYVAEFTPGREFRAGGTSAQRIALRATAPAATDVTASILLHV